MESTKETKGRDGRASGSGKKKVGGLTTAKKLDTASNDGFAMVESRKQPTNGQTSISDVSKDHPVDTGTIPTGKKKVSIDDKVVAKSSKNGFATVESQKSIKDQHFNSDVSKNIPVDAGTTPTGGMKVSMDDSTGTETNNPSQSSKKRKSKKDTPRCCECSSNATCASKSGTGRGGSKGCACLLAGRKCTDCLCSNQCK